MKLVLVFIASLCFLLKAEPIQFVAEDLPPYHYQDKNGHTKGVLVDVIKAVANKANIAYEVQIYPFARAYKMLKTKPNVVMFSLLKSPNREGHFLWLGNIFHNSAYLVSLNGDNKRLSHLEQAKGFTVGTIRGYYSETYLRKAGFGEGENLSLSVNYQNLWRMLFKKRIDFVLTNTLSLTSELNKLGYTVKEVTKVIELKDFPNKLHLAANKAFDADTAHKLKVALQAIKDNGEYQKILTRWGWSSNTEN